MQRATVVCTTLTGVLMRDLRDLHFDVAVVDEAAQVLNHSFLNASICNLRHCFSLSPQHELALLRLRAL